MIHKYLDLIQIFFFINPYVVLLVILMLLIILIIFSIYVLYLIYDSCYQANNVKKKTNWFLDMLCPLVLLSVPILLLLFVKTEEIVWLYKFCFLLAYHTLITMPLLYYWSLHRNWGQKVNLLINKTKLKPATFYSIGVSLLYPIYFGIYISILRMVRIGSEITIPSSFNHMVIESLIVLGFLWPYISIYLRLTIWKITDLRIFLWNEFMEFIEILTIYLLQFKIYFKFMVFLWKISFLWLTFVSNYQYIYPKPTKLRKLLHYIYIYPIIVYILFIMSVILEALLMDNHLYYSIQVLIIFLLLKPFFYFFNNFNGPYNKWIEICCISNYLYSKWDNPYYPDKFWLNFIEIRRLFGEYPKIESDIFEKIKELIFENRNIYNQKKIYRARIISVYYSKKRQSFKNKLKLGYYEWTQTIWDHTENKNIYGVKLIIKKNI